MEIDKAKEIFNLQKQQINMETRTQIVTQLVAAFLTNPVRMEQIRYGMDAEYKFYGSDHEIAVAYANIVANEIIDKTTEEIVFPETVV